VEGAVVEGRDREVGYPVDALVTGVGVATVADAGSIVEPAFVAESDHVLRVERFDVC